MSDGDHLPAPEEAPQLATGGSTPKMPRAGARPFFSRIFGSLAGEAGSRPPANLRPAHHVIALCHALLSERGGVSGLRLASEALSAYQSLDAPERAGIDADRLHLFRSWFNRGFLVLHRIDWHSSALLLERLIRYEAVHQIQGWNDLRRRLEADRRCYAFMHPALPEEPLIFIEVALMNGMSARVQPLLDPESPVVDPAVVHCEIFYSITN